MLIRWAVLSLSLISSVACEPVAPCEDAGDFGATACGTFSDVIYTCTRWGWDWTGSCGDGRSCRDTYGGAQCVGEPVAPRPRPRSSCSSCPDSCVNGSCVECTSDRHCVTGMVCDPSTYRCGLCASDLDCSGRRPFCGSLGTINACVECLRDSDCGPHGQAQCNDGYCRSTDP